MSKTELFVRQDPGGVFAVVDEAVVTGNIFWVDSGQTTTGADSVGYGLSPDKPFVTLDYAFSSDVCTANNGDVIYIMPGHAESVISAGDITQDIAGVKVIGLGQGADRPTFTFSTATTATWVVSAASSWIENVILLCGLDQVVNNLVFSAADCTVKNVEIQDASSTVEFVGSILTTAAADRLVIDGLRYLGFPAGTHCTTVVNLAGVTDPLIVNSSFYGEISTAVIRLSVLSTNVLVDNCYFYNDNVALTKNLTDVGSSTWAMTNCYDGKGGYSFSGGSAAALAADDVGTVSTAVSGLTSSFLAQSAAVSGLTSSALAASTAVSGITSTLVTVLSYVLSGW